MNHAYLYGVATVPAVIVACGAALVALRALLRLGARISVVGLRLTPEADERRRALAAATVHAAPRAWILGVGDLGLVVFAGQDPDVRSTAYQRLNPPIELRPFDRPARRTFDAAGEEDQW